MENLNHKGVFYLLKKRTIALISSYFIALILTLFGLIYVNFRSAQTYKTYVSNTYQHAFAEFITSVGEIDSALQKSLYVTSPKMISSTCTEVFAKALSAQMAMGELPFVNNELEHTAGFITKVGDYAYTLSKNAYNGNGYTDEEYKNLQVLSDATNVLSQNLIELYAQVNSGEITISDLTKSQETLSASEDSMIPSDLAGSFKLMENEFPEIPSLIYDGPFSEHIKQMSPKLLENKPEIDKEQAKYSVANFFGTDEKNVVYLGLRQDEVPVYIFQISGHPENTIAEITVNGGEILNIINSRNVEMQNISSEDAVKIAQRFLENHNYKNMKTTYYHIENNSATVNFAYCEDDIIFYPDLIKVRVALDNGEITNLECLGYIMSRTDRNLPQNIISRQQAESSVSDKLKILSHQTALIPTSGKNEVLCHEFKCENENKQHYIVYVNAQTGTEENILILLEDETGTLVL